MNFKKLSTMLFSSSLIIGAPIASTVINNAQAATVSSSEAAKNLNIQLSKTGSMTANFSQTTSGSKSSNSSFSGKMSVKRPNGFRWDIKSPSDQLIVSSGSKMWVYDKDLEQVTIQSVNGQVGNTPALLLSGNPSQIASNFTVKQPKAGTNFYVLYPKSASANFKNMGISFNGGKPVMMVLNDNLGQTTSIKFTNIKQNPAINSSQFTFTPPAGVDVIRQ